MSDDFDKEAERKRLREKYERDEEDRETTERMSELLLQGATMTNRHCDTCGSPIFRYQGQEFCPNCQVTTEAEAAASQQSTTGEASAQASSQRDSPGAAGRASQEGTSAGAEGGRTRNDSSEEGQPPATQDERPSATQDERPPATGDERPPATQPPQQPATQPSQQPATGDSGSDAGGGPWQRPGNDVTMDENAAEQIRASLTQTLATFAQRAAQTDDPHRAREFLKTAKTAAETLRSLPR